ncbi:HEAT repeat domain-containing protein [Nitrospira tepida]|uniref:HEAT repeat domain-containing protein n=1 Tax=Nitrospira tepida TaxID=2973512 RepID=UPI00259D0132|nr:HEAT repeat domain-containing protein [Nitrospira tepida]
MTRLIRLAGDRDPEVRLTAVLALGRIGAEESASTLRERLQDNDSRVRQWSAWALGNLNRPDALPQEQAVSLVARLGDPVQPVRLAAAQALNELDQDPGIARWLLEAFQSQESEMRKAAARALIGQVGSDALPTLIRASADQDAEVRQAVVAALGELGDARAIPPLLDRLAHDPADSVRAEAAFRLGKIGTADLVWPLRQAAMSDKDAQVRRWAAAAVEAVSSVSGSG